MLRQRGCSGAVLSDFHRHHGGGIAWKINGEDQCGKEQSGIWRITSYIPTVFTQTSCADCASPRSRRLQAPNIARSLQATAHHASIVVCSERGYMIERVKGGHITDFIFLQYKINREVIQMQLPDKYADILYNAIGPRKYPRGDRRRANHALAN